MTPAEVPGTSARSFYRQELMLSTVQDTSPMVSKSPENAYGSP